MQTTEYIRTKINKYPKGYVFTYTDFVTEVNTREAIIKYLNRLVSSGKIKKLSKGKYYKPETSVFGELVPEQYQVVKDLLEKEGKLIGYITGYSIYNQLGLTTQLSNTIQIGRNEVRPALKRGIYKVAFVKQKNTITKENIPSLQFLDALRYIKKIPDTSVDNSCKRFMVLLSERTTEEKAILVRLGLKYSPVTRALLGALLEQQDSSINTNTLKKSLNPITVFQLSISETVLPNAKEWSIR